MPATAAIASPDKFTLEAPRVALATRDGEHLVVAQTTIDPGEWLLTIEGELVSAPCRYSVQVGPDEHIAPPAALIRPDGNDAYLWRFLNHSCNPNAIIVRRVLIAIRAIAAGEEITFDYNTNEYAMASPFNCRCGHCGGVEIRGFHYLTPAEKKMRQHRLADHLRE